MIIHFIKEKLKQRCNKTRHNTVKLAWQKAELQRLLENKDTMTPEEFQEAYRRLK